jgi:hypothetical protein
MRRRGAHPGRVALAVLVALGGIVLYSGIRREPVSAAAGREYFHRRDLGSPYATGIPYALALAAMERYPEDLGKDRAAFCEKFGVLRDPDNLRGLPLGFVLHRDPWTGTDFLMTNCSLCHTAVIGGRKIDGLGNRNLRLNALNHAIMRIAGRPDANVETMLPAAEAAARRRHIPWDWRSRWVTKVAIRKLKELAAHQKADAWGGMSGVDAGPGRNTPIEFAKAASDVPIRPPYGLAKIPAAWIYGKRRTFGWDGSLVGDRALALAAVEFNKGMPLKEILKRPERWQSVYLYLKQLQPPPYSEPVDAARARRGHALFRAHCAGCHGTYGPDEPERYEERVVPLSVVRTDPDRLRSVTPELIAARHGGAFGTRVTLQARDGYVPPPLDGIWCRGPYLHNGSVPTLADLLRPAQERPVSFYIGGDTEYDLTRLGVAYLEQPRADRRRAGGRQTPRQFLFDTQSPGNANGGHEFGTHLTALDRQALLEYLKTV